jgi:hypothetical protein
MPTSDFIIELFCRIDAAMADEPKHRQASLWPSEIVTLGILFALEGVGNRAFSRKSAIASGSTSRRAWLLPSRCSTCLLSNGMGSNLMQQVVSICPLPSSICSTSTIGY